MCIEELFEEGQRQPLIDALLVPVPAVYALWDAADCLLYVGQTSNLAARLQQHRRNAKMQAATAFSYVAVRELDKRLELETIAIVTKRPPLNQAIALRVAGGRLYELHWKRQRKRGAP